MLLPVLSSWVAAKGPEESGSPAQVVAEEEGAGMSSGGPVRLEVRAAGSQPL